jgi:hypothetical protein
LSEREEKGMKINEERRNKDEGIGDQKKKRGGKKNGKDKKKNKEKKKRRKAAIFFFALSIFRPSPLKKKKERAPPTARIRQKGFQRRDFGWIGGRRGKGEVRR